MKDELSNTIAQGKRELAAGNLESSQEWLERARRIAPSNSVVLLALAGVLLARDNPKALQLYRELADSENIREAWLGLAGANLVHGDLHQATAALDHGLSRYAHSAASISPVADAIVNAADTIGWCILNGAGILTVCLRTATASKTVVADIDGHTIALQRQSRSRLLVGRLPPAWESAQTITVKAAGSSLVGSPIFVNRIMRVEGFADSTDGDIYGWAWYPNNPDRNPTLSVVSLNGSSGLTVEADDDTVQLESSGSFAKPRGFRVPAERLRELVGPVRVLGPDGKNLTGSPLDPSAERISAESASGIVARLFPAPGQEASGEIPMVLLPAVPAHIVGRPPFGGASKRPVDVVVPVYGGLDLTLSCLETVLADLPTWARVIVVDDASPDPLVQEKLGHLARQGRILMLAQSINRGFPSSANIGMRHDAKRDVVLLNSDTLVPPGWLQRLREAAYSAPEIGSVTPFSNDATIISYPTVDLPNAIPNISEMIQLDVLAQKANADIVVDIPTAVGFCMYIKRDCLNVTGLFRDDQFGQGYGEENDFCIRARHLGWRHVAAPGIFVAHIGGQSFGTTKQYLIKRNMRLLNRLHPGYDKLIQDFQQIDPMSEPRKRLDMERWKLLRAHQDSVVLVTHGRGGGVRRRVFERAHALRAEGLRPILIWPVGRHGGNGRDCVLGDGPEGGTPNLRFCIPEELDQLAFFLKADRPIRAEVHHLVGHDHAILDLFSRLEIPYEVVVHDYSWFCPRINLIGPERRYCGEPDVPRCEACVADVGTTNDEDTPPRALRERSAAELSGAARIVVPSQDVAVRLRRHFPLVTSQIEAWEDDSELPPLKFPSIDRSEVRICVIGAISVEKGYEVLLACARDAAERKLPLAFRLVGFSCDDSRLLETTKVHITGPYEEHEVVAMVKSQQAQLAWLSSLWPETWCYTLTYAWKAGLNTAAFDIGAPAERIRKSGRGWLFPLGLSPAALNNKFMVIAESGSATKFDSDSSIIGPV